MKKYLLTFVLFIFVINCNAQFSVGVRGGATYLFSTYGIPKKNEFREPDPQLNWDKDVVMRYAIKRWAFEASLNHDKYDYGTYYSNHSMMPHVQYRIVIDKTTTNQFVFNTLAQYNYSWAGKKKRLRNYIGLAFGTHYYCYKHERTTENVKGEVDYSKSNTYDVTVWPGVHHTTTFDLNEKIVLSTQAFYRYYYYPFSVTGMAINSQAGIGIGAAYKL